MATIDTSRSATDFRKHYAGVGMQQGRVLTDDDFNESASLDAEDRRRTRVDVIGPAGSPDQGFLITDPVIDATNGRPTFTIKAGTFYLGGQRLTLEADELYHLQKDWLEQGAVAGDWLAVPAVQRFDLAYLETWEQPVSVVEDSELLEIALGGPDTSVRTRIVRRVRVLPGVASGDCNGAWAALLASLSEEGTINPVNNELVPDASLKVEPDGTTGSSDLCSPPVAGGYLGAENQAIRVQITGAGEFTWGYDNAAPLYRVQLGVDSVALRRRITMVTEPKDQAHWPLIGQVVELLPWSAVLANGQKISELHGHLAKVTASYDPDAKTFDIDTVPPDDASGQAFGETWNTRVGPGGDAASLDNEGDFYYLRVWNRGSDTGSQARISFTAGTAVALEHTGLKATFSGAQLRLDDFWIIAARPDAPTTFLPWDLATGRQPHGVRRWIAPLAVISWPGGNAAGVIANDCRDPFLPLTSIQTCCTVTVGDGDVSHGHFSSIQKAVESLPDSGGRVCVLAGTYKENIQILNRHDIVISGCGPRTLVQGPPPAGGAASALPAISVIGGYNIGLECFAVEADDTGIGVLLLGFNPYSGNQSQDAAGTLVNVSVTGLSVVAGLRDALRARFVRGLVVERCEFRNNDETGLDHTVTLLVDDGRFERNVVEVAKRSDATVTAQHPPRDFYPGAQAFGGVQLQGMCSSVALIDNVIRGGSGHGITLGSVRTVTDPNDSGPGDDGGGTVSVDPCSTRDNFEIFVYYVQGATSFTISEGALDDIRIERNRISDMGGCGIGVDRFFDLSGADEFISVSDLTIGANEITRCQQRTIEEPTEAAAGFVGYGGIALADVENLVVRDNTVSFNGAQASDPICGIFALHVEGADISRNRILDNGDTGEAVPAGTAKRGQRGGIVLVFALAPTRQIVLPGGVTAPDQSGVPAAKIHDNIVTTPLGQALLLNALGPVSVLNNQFTTRGVAGFAGSSGFLASTIWILNLGFPDEFYLEYLAFASFGSATVPKAGLDDATIGHALANGQVLFANNQVESDFLAKGFTLSISPILIITLDDIGFHDNQCEANTLDDFILSQVLLFGLSLRATNNRLKEGMFNAIISALTIGLFANTTVLNQATHCIIAMGGNLQDAPNTAIVGPNPLLSGSFDGTCGGYDKSLRGAFQI